MSLSQRRMRSIGWLALLAFCATLVMVLTLRVNALRSQVRHEENKIIALREETMYLQTEFETRASQQQLKAWNDVDFGYVAPAAGQYLENERQLAMLGKPAGPDAPAPVRLAEAGDGAGEAEGGMMQASASGPGFPAMVSPLTGRPFGSAVRSDAVVRNLADSATLAAGHVGALAGSGRADAAPGSGSDSADRVAQHAAAAAALGDRLGHVDHSTPGKAKSAKAKAAKSKTAAGKAKAGAKTKPTAKAKSAKPTKTVTKAKSPAASAHKARTHSSETPA